MKHIALILVVLLASCEKTEMPTPNSSNEKRGGNSNPCSGYVIFPAVYPTATDWNISADTNSCGIVILRWNNQAGFSNTSDPCNAIHGKYFVNIQPRPITCSGSAVSTNAFFYYLGSGCSMWPNQTYTVTLSWVKRDDATQTNIYYSSQPKIFTTGKRAPYLNNCN